MNLFAYTAPTPVDVYYPEYISVNRRDDGAVVLTVRSRGAQNCSEITLSPEQLRSLATALNGR